MERVKTVFTCVGLRVVSGTMIEVKFQHQDDQVVLRVPSDVKVALGHKYTMSMKPYEEEVVNTSLIVKETTKTKD